jgi:hypothetical protein
MLDWLRTPLKWLRAPLKWLLALLMWLWALLKWLCAFLKWLWGWLTWLWQTAVKQPYSWLRAKLLRPPSPPAEVTPYVVLYTAPATFNHLTVKIGDYHGLLFAHVIKDSLGQELRIITAWQSRDAYTAMATAFLTNSGLENASATVPWHGVLGDTLQTRMPWWSYLTPARVIAVITFVFLALSWAKEIRDASGWLVGAPEVEMVKASKPVNVVVGSPVNFTMGARNTRRIGECYMRFNDPSPDPAGYLQLDPLSPKSYPAIAPNAEVDVPIRGTATRAGRCNVILTGEATFGLWKRSRPISSAYPVQVWLSVAFGRRAVKDPKPKYCECEVELLVGRRFPSGLEVEAKIEKVPRVKFFAVRFPGNPRYTAVHNWDEPNKEVATLVWRTNELEAFRSMTFSLLFENLGENLTKDGWELVVQKVEFTHEEAH